MTDSASPGLRASLRALAASSLGVLQTRLALAGLELEEEIQRLVGLLVLAMGATVFASLGLMVLTLLVVATFWETDRVAVCAALTLIYLGMAAFLGWRIRRALVTRPPVLAATLEELGKDRAALQPHHVEDEGRSS